MTGLGDANWKTRLAALDELTPWLEAEVESLDAEVVVRALAKKGWNEKNFQVYLPFLAGNFQFVVDHIFFKVSARIYGSLAFLAQQCPSFGRSCVALCVGHLTEKLGDMKLKKPAGDTLLSFAEKTSLQFVLGQGILQILTLSNLQLTCCWKRMTLCPNKKLQRLWLMRLPGSIPL